MGVTEVFLTRVSQEKEGAYREWLGKIHRIEASFPGFRGVYVQAPKSKEEEWITLLHFDTPEHLDRWLASSERQEVLKALKPLVTSLKSHRLASPYAGWFLPAIKKGETPSAWKQTMIVLLVLFPLVMLELKFLSPLTSSLNFSLATFIGNALSVTLIAWPLMPIALFFLNWWLASEKGLTNQLGILLLIGLYLLEIAIFWN